MASGLELCAIGTGSIFGLYSRAEDLVNPLKQVVPLTFLEGTLDLIFHLFRRVHYANCFLNSTPHFRNLLLADGGVFILLDFRLAHGG